MYRQLRPRRALMQFNNVRLRTKKALSLYKVYGTCVSLVLNGTSLNSISALLALSRRYKNSRHPNDNLGQDYDCFHTRAKCVIWLLIRNAHFELKFGRRYFGPCVRQITSRCVIWNAHFKWRSGGVFKLSISQITQRKHRMNALTSKSWFWGRS